MNDAFVDMKIGEEEYNATRKKEKCIICPKCSDEIFSLDYSATKKVSWNGTAYFKEDKEELFLNHEQDNCSEDYPDYDGEPKTDYICPECSEILFDNEKDALEFWKENAKEEKE